MLAKRSFPVGTFILTTLVIIGLVVMIIRYLSGLGAISNLSDDRAWGHWISFDLYCGVALSTLHQSSLGSMLLMMPETLHALWYTPILPILFLVSAIAVGPAMVIFESTLSTKIFGHRLDIDVLAGLSRAIPYILGLYLLLKIVDLLAVGELVVIFTAYPQNLLWWGEIVIGVITPIILFSFASVRQNRPAVFWTSVLVIVGLMLNRFNVSMLALDMRTGTIYFPHWMEFAISVGLVADALLVIWLAHRLLPIVPHEEVSEVKA